MFPIPGIVKKASFSAAYIICVGCFGFSDSLLFFGPDNMDDFEPLLLTRPNECLSSLSPSLLRFINMQLGPRCLFPEAAARRAREEEGWKVLRLNECMMSPVVLCVRAYHKLRASCSCSFFHGGGACYCYSVSLRIERSAHTIEYEY